MNQFFGTTTNQAELSYFVYPHWDNYDSTNPRTTKTIDYQLSRDHSVAQGTKNVYFEFLYIYSPDMGNPAETFNGQEVGCHIIKAGGHSPYFGNDIANAYSSEFCDEIRETVPDPYVTLSGLGSTRDGKSNLTWFLNQSQEYKSRTIDFIVDFAYYECSFDGININFERLGVLSNTECDLLLEFYRELIEKAHNIGLKVIKTTQADVYERHIGNGVFEPRVYQGRNKLNNTLYYPLDFDYINYMCIDNFWQIGYKYGGHFSYKCLKVLLDKIKLEDSKYANRTIIQFANYAVWGYNEGHFGVNGTKIKSMIDVGDFVDNEGTGNGQIWQYEIKVKHQLEALIMGDEAGADIWKWWRELVVDQGRINAIRWSAGDYSLSQSSRLDGDDSLVVTLGQGIVNNRDQLTVGDTFLMWHDQYAIDKKCQYVFQNYGINKFSIWHGHRNTVWFSYNAINTINNNNGVPIWPINNPKRVRPSQIPQPEPQPEPLDLGLEPQPLIGPTPLTDEQAQCYLNRYPDLQNAFGPNNIELAKKHWIEFGYNEQRNPNCPTPEPPPEPTPIVEPTPEPVPEPIPEPIPEPVPEPIIGKKKDSLYLYLLGIASGVLLYKIYDEN